MNVLRPDAEVHFLFADDYGARLIELELIDRSLRHKKNVTVVFCDGILPACTINPQGHKLVCRSCMSRTRYHLRLVRDITVLPMSSFLNVGKRINISGAQLTPSMLMDLKEPVLGFGYGPLSSAISLTRDMKFREIATSQLAQRMLASAHVVWGIVNRVLDQHQPSRCVVHNGRFAEYCTVYLACKQRQVDIETHELLVPPHRWVSFMNTRIHDKAGFIEVLQLTANVAMTEHGEVVASQYLNKKRFGQTYYENHTRLQSIGQLPDLLHGRKVISIFTSSEDEFASIGPEWQQPFYSSQLNGVLQIVTDLLGSTDEYQVVLRLHPNMRSMHKDDVEEYLNISVNGLIVLPPDSNVDSYALIDHSDKVVTFGSTIGLEATYWQKPSIQIGPSYFDNLDVVYLPTSHFEVMDLIQSDLPAKDSKSTYQYIYAISNGGHEFVASDSYEINYRNNPLITERRGLSLIIQGIFNNWCVTMVISKIAKYIRIRFKRLTA